MAMVALIFPYIRINCTKYSGSNMQTKGEILRNGALFVHIVVIDIVMIMKMLVVVTSHNANLIYHKTR